MTTSITTGTLIKIEKGCKALDISKGTTARVLEVRELGSEFSHQVSVTFKFLNGFKAGKTVTLTARHLNRLADPSVRLHNGNPTKNIEIKRV